jgi:hypothetical protein
MSRWNQLDTLIRTQLASQSQQLLDRRPLPDSAL